MKKQIIMSILLSVAMLPAWGQNDSDSTTVLKEVTVSTGRKVMKLKGASNTDLITSGELRKAACCNLGESFTTNPSVDVSYSDAATGARQIKLLGLSGSYVQMLTENIPNFRGAAAPYGLGYIAGPWMSTIAVSKGASSVKNGYESITGQINVEMKKPQDEPQLAVNMYYDSNNKIEANVDGNLHFGEKWSGSVLAHAENGFTAHDINGDGFADMPKVRQFAVMPRVAYLGENYVMQAAVKGLDERRLGGQIVHGKHFDDPYKINIDTRRVEAFTKNAYIFDHENEGNIALILSGSVHDQKANYGHRVADILEKEAYSSLMFERKWDGMHGLSLGLQANYDDYRYRTILNPTLDDLAKHSNDKEGVVGAYGQYTLTLGSKLTAMAGLRYDWSTVYGSLVTPRLHLRYNPDRTLSFHASAGRGSRSPHPLAEYSYMLASSRRLEIAPDLKRESAWNYGAGVNKTFYPADKKLTLSGEYYFTNFSRQLLLDLNSNPHAAIISSSDRRSFSHALQLEASFDVLEDLNLTAAWRFTDVKVDYGQGLVQKPLTSRYKGLFTASYAPMMGIWQFDLSLALNSGGKMPTPYRLADGAMSWSENYKAYPRLNAQITRNFRQFAVYLGGENLTGYHQKNAIIDAANPWGPNFDATMIYGPLDGAMVYAGFRFNFTQY